MCGLVFVIGWVKEFVVCFYLVGGVNIVGRVMYVLVVNGVEDLVFLVFWREVWNWACMCFYLDKIEVCKELVELNVWCIDFEVVFV